MPQPLRVRPAEAGGLNDIVRMRAYDPLGSQRERCVDRLPVTSEGAA
jgi:hypothetical protein